MTKEIIRRILDIEPNLTDFGMGIYEFGLNMTPEERKTKFIEKQNSLLNNVEQFQKACQWLSTKDKINSINQKHNSYGLKHLAEKEIGYITNGIFIAAAIHCGFKVKKFDDSPNVCINISEKSLRT